MAILIGLVLALVVLYFWLVGHWFARVVVFLAFAVILGLLIGGLMPPLDPHAALNPLGFLIGGVVAWFVSGIPIYRQRHQKRQTARAGQFVYPLHWTIGEIDAYERDASVAAEYRPTAHFPVLRLL